MEPPEIVTVDSETVSCDGGSPALGHPRVFLNLGDEGQVDCPYCGRRFVLAGHRDEPAQAAEPTAESPRRSSAA
jgi:uncharacterized Zn-finger protein